MGDNSSILIRSLISVAYALLGGYVTLYTSMDMGATMIVAVIIFYGNMIYSEL